MNSIVTAQIGNVRRWKIAARKKIKIENDQGSVMYLCKDVISCFVETAGNNIGNSADIHLDSLNPTVSDIIFVVQVLRK